MTEQAREARRRYNRAYYAAHKEQAKEAQRKHWEKVAAEAESGEKDGD